MFLLLSFKICICISILGALIYRVIPPRSEGHKLGLKCGHAIIMMVTFVIMVIGLQVSQHPDNNL